MKNLTFRLTPLLLALLCLGGCSTVKPWERGTLAEAAMQVDAYPVETFMNEHIYFSKEAATGGNALSGGGCGCN
jgi:Domain of unknown function (DUF4266)